MSNKIKVYYLNSCNTCVRIMKELGIDDSNAEIQNIKETNVSAKELDAMKEQEGSYEALFSRRAMKYRSEGLNEMTLTEADYKKYILGEYTFLKRPVIQIGETYFVGNTKKVIAAAKAKLEAN